jgi:putative endopeptidase
VRKTLPGLLLDRPCVSSLACFTLLFALWAAPPARAQEATPDSTARSGLDPADMDPGVSACQDFYHYADGGWIKRNPVPPAYPSWGSFNELAERNRDNLRKILDRAAADRMAPKGSDVQKIGDYYASCMDEAKVEEEGVKPLEPDFARIANIHDSATLEAEIARLQSEGVNAVFNYGSQQDRKNSSEVIAGAFQGGLGLPDRDYYTKTDEKSKTIRDEYVRHVTRMFELLGDAPARAADEAHTVMAIETRLAEASMTRVERRDPDATYHRMTPEGLAGLTPNFSWVAFLRETGTPPVQGVNIGQPKFFEAVNGMLKGVPVDEWKTYLRWHLVHSAAPALSKKFVDENFDFYGKTLQGTKEILPRWKRCVAATDRALGFALGKIYVAEYFPPEAKRRADVMVHNLISALRADIQTLPWMGEETKKAALAKLDAFTPKIGYPDKWRDYSAFEVDRSSYAGNVVRGEIYEFHRDLDKIGKPVDRTEWGMTPPTVNAYYNPPKNEIVFPAGILQPPFFYSNGDDAINYGGIGSVIGHEMTHGFDDEGRKFDAQGNLKNWWTPEDQKRFEERAKCVEEQFDAYPVQGDLHENGKLVLGESIADLGGLTIAHKAYERSLEGKPTPPPIDGLTNEQRFFLAWARIWANNDRPEFERLMVTVNPHPLDHYRAIAAPSNMPSFAKAFGCAPDSPMVRKNRCEIW